LFSRKVDDRQTDTQTDRQTDRRRVKHNVHGGGNKVNKCASHNKTK